MMKSRLFALLALLVLIAGVLPVVGAQEATSDPSALNCLNLSEADCAILEAAGGGMDNITSFSPSFTVDFTISGANSAMPGMAMDTAFNAKGQGAVVVDHAAMTKDAPYGGVTASVDVNTTDSKGSKDLSYVVADGVVYWKDSATGEWKGAQIADLEKAVKSGKMPNIGISMDSFGPMGGMMGGMGGMMGNIPSMPSTTNGAGMEMFGMDMSGFMNIPGVLKQERGADTTVDGQTMQVFTYTADIGAFLSSEQFQTMLNGAMAQAGSGSSDNPMASQMMAMLPIMLQSTTGSATFTRWIGADDHFVHHIALDVNAAMDLFGGATSTKVTPLPPIQFKLAAAVDLTNINNTTAPTAPTGATMLSAEELVAPEATPAQ